jgi:uncharacterized protein
MNLEDGKKLIKLARNSILTYFSHDKLKLEDTKKYQKEQGVFVTLTKNSELRGCIGFPVPVMPLQKAVIDAARAASFEDPRFPALQEKEINEICIEVSVLTIPEIIEVKSPDEYIKKIKIGKHGLIIRKGIFSGLLLPQVFIDYNSTPEQALEMTCQKAGLYKDAWKEEDSKIFIFSAQIFKEENPDGTIVEEKIEP